MKPTKLIFLASVAFLLLQSACRTQTPGTEFVPLVYDVSNGEPAVFSTGEIQPNAKGLSVTIGNVPCVVTGIDSTTLTVLVANVPVGEQTVAVNQNGKPVTQTKINILAPPYVKLVLNYSNGKLNLIATEGTTEAPPADAGAFTENFWLAELQGPGNKALTTLVVPQPAGMEIHNEKGPDGYTKTTDNLVTVTVPAEATALKVYELKDSNQKLFEPFDTAAARGRLIGTFTIKK